jgi:hypothetical protein
MHPTRTFTFSCLALVALIALIALSGQAFAANYAQVGACTPPNPVTLAHTYATIQLAVTGSAPGTVIQICPGKYPEQVVIGKKLALLGVGDTLINPTQDAAVIVPPTTGMVANASDVDDSHPIAAQLFVHDTFAAVITITNLTVDGLGNAIAGCGPDFMGILYQNASGTVNHVAVRNQVPGDVLNGCQSGESIYVQTATGFTSKVTVENSSVHNYNKNGITGNDPNTKLVLIGNYVQGSGVVAGLAAQNGIQLGFGATGSIGSETVIDNIYQDPSVAATDILLYDTAENSGIKVTGNILGNSQIPIALYQLNDDPPNFGDVVTVTGNKIFGTSTWDAIDVCTSGNTIMGNTIFNSAESGVHLDAFCGTFGGPASGNSNLVTGNTILESECAGILADTGTASNTTSPDTYWTVPFPVTSSTGSCPFVTGPTRTKAKTARKYSPKR